jgi:hypothetical protein
MEKQMVSIEVDPTSAILIEALKRKAEEQGKTLDELLRPLAEDINEANGEAETQTLTPFELAGNLFGAIDSSVPDPTSPPRHTAFGAYLIEKHGREVKRSSALANIAAQQGIAPDEWVRRNFPNGRDSQGRSLSEALDTLILEEDSKPNDTH